MSSATVRFHDCVHALSKSDHSCHNFGRLINFLIDVDLFCSLCEASDFLMTFVLVIERTKRSSAHAPASLF